MIIRLSILLVLVLAGGCPLPGSQLPLAGSGQELEASSEAEVGQSVEEPIDLSAELSDSAELSPVVQAAGDALLDALLTKLEILAENIANSRTIGYKASAVTVHVDTSRSGASRVILDETLCCDAGQSIETRRPLDVLIEGPGFFRVVLPGGRTGYTRAGNFVRNASGTLVLNDSLGYPLADDVAVPPQVAPNEIVISPTGELRVLDGRGGYRVVGRLKLATFAEPERLKRREGSVYVATPAAGTCQVEFPGRGTAGRLVGGYLEASNVDAAADGAERALVREQFETVMALLTATLEAP